MNKKLPREIVALIHHIELNKAGWWDKAAKQIIVATIWSNEKNLSIEEISVSVKSQHEIHLDFKRLEVYLSELCSSNILVCSIDAKYKLSEEHSKIIVTNIKEVEINEEDVKGIFSKLISQLCPSLSIEDTWSDFSTNFLFPYIKEAGASSYHMVVGDQFIFEPTNFEAFLQKYPKNDRFKLAIAIKEFFNPKLPEIRSYILRELNANLFSESGNLSEQNLIKLEKISEAKPIFNVFIDTNYIFSILGVRENPLNEAANSLLDLITQLKDRVLINL